MTPRENLRRAMEESFARQWGGRWSVGLADDEPAQRDLVDGDHALSRTAERSETGSRHPRALRTTTAP